MPKIPATKSKKSTTQRAADPSIRGTRGMKRKSTGDAGKKLKQQTIGKRGGKRAAMAKAKALAVKQTKRTSKLESNCSRNKAQIQKRTRTSKAPTPRQSPIDIRTNDLCHDPKECKADSLNIDCKAGDCSDVICTSTGFRVNPGRNCKSTFSSPYLKDVYEFAQFHAHWGQDASCGSEHTIDGKKYAAEVHFVFYNTKYGSFAEAAEKDDGLAVIGVLLEKGDHNPNYEVLIDTVKKGIGNDKPVPMPKGYSWEGLLPPSNKRDFVTYLGSLTTPPYLESVIWTVFLTPVNISDQQLSILRKITPANYRSCQDVCGRTVRCSKAGSNSNVYL